MSMYNVNTRVYTGYLCLACPFPYFVPLTDFKGDLKCILFYFDMSITFWLGVSSNLSQEKSPTAEILDKY